MTKDPAALLAHWDQVWTRPLTVAELADYHTFTNRRNAEIVRLRDAGMFYPAISKRVGGTQIQVRKIYDKIKGRKTLGRYRDGLQRIIQTRTIAEARRLASEALNGT